MNDAIEESGYQGFLTMLPKKVCVRSVLSLYMFSHTS
jgi:hypothetical protein